MPKKVTLFTIGYQQRSIDDYVTCLTRAGVTVLADVRDHPHSRFKPEFGKKQLSETMKKSGISYIHVEAAGNPRHIRDAAEDLDESLKNYKKYLTKSQSGLDDLETIIRANTAVCLSCYERSVDDCHRQYLAAALVKRIPTIKVVHL